MKKRIILGTHLTHWMTWVGGLLMVLSILVSMGVIIYCIIGKVTNAVDAETINSVFITILPLCVALWFPAITLCVGSPDYKLNAKQDNNN
jgi:hypothetical protein